MVGMRFVAMGIHRILGTPVGDDGWSSGVIVSVWLLNKVCRCPQNVKVVAPPPMESRGSEIEKLLGGCSPTTC
jgi:hypothetical protein